MRTLGFRGKKSRLCREWGTRRNLFWGKLGKGETIRELRKIQGFISREWVKILLGKTTVFGPIWVIWYQCVSTTRWPNFTWFQGKRCLLASGAIWLFSVLLELFMGFHSDSKGTDTRALWGTWPSSLVGGLFGGMVLESAPNYRNGD